MVKNTKKTQSFDELLNKINEQSFNKNFDNYDEDESPSPVKDMNDHILLREYEKKGDNFEAKDNYYKMDMETFDLVNINDSEDTIFYLQDNNSYFYKESCIISNLEQSEEINHMIELENKKFLDIYIFKNMFLDADEYKISKQDLIIRLALNNIELETKFIKDLYLDIYYQIHIKDSILEEKQYMSKKYFFPINMHILATPQQLILE